MDIKRLFPVADARRENEKEKEREAERAGSGARRDREKRTGERLQLTGFPAEPRADA